MSPLIDITLRRDSKGGGRLSECRGTEAAFEPRARRILLVHGYNVSEDEAEREFERFKSTLDKFSSWLAKDVGRVYWPGDASIPLIRPAWYPWKVPEAIACGPVFAQYLAKRKGPRGTQCNLILIGHSLGCRLVLETLKALTNLKHPGGSLRLTVFLMAAAVPVERVKKNSDLRQGVKLARQVLVLYSPDDTVLSKFFPLGQMVAPGDKGRFPEAVGLYGNPNRLWADRRKMDRYGHGDYWKSPEVAQYVASLLGASVKKPLHERDLPRERKLEYRSAPVTRNISKSRSIKT